MTTQKNKSYLNVASPYKTVSPKSSHVDFLVRVVTPEKEKQNVRKNIAIVIDTSGSMSGRPLQDAIQGASAFIDMCGPDDQVALVSYSYQAHVLSAPLLCSEANKKALKHHLAALSAGGDTALHAGWLHGAQQIAPFVDRFDLSRVILLSDGGANVGQSVPEEFKKDAARLLIAGISTSTFGLSMHFNEQIMTSLAQGGHAFYAENSSQLFDYFGSEHNMISLSSARRVRIKSSEGTLLNDFPTDDGFVLLPDTLVGGETWCVLRVKNEKGAKLSVLAEWQEGGEVLTDSLTLTVGASKSNVKTKEHGDILERVKELDAAALQREAAEKARQGRWSDVNEIVGSLRGMAMGNAYVSNVAAALSTMSVSCDANALSKEALYASATMNSRTILKDDDVKVSTDKLGLKKSAQGLASSSKEGEKS